MRESSTPDSQGDAGREAVKPDFRCPDGWPEDVCGNAGRAVKGVRHKHRCDCRAYIELRWEGKIEEGAVGALDDLTWPPGTVCGQDGSWRTRLYLERLWELIDELTKNRARILASALFVWLGLLAAFLRVADEPDSIVSSTYVAIAEVALVALFLIFRGLFLWVNGQIYHARDKQIECSYFKLGIPSENVADGKSAWWNTFFTWAELFCVGIAVLVILSQPLWSSTTHEQGQAVSGSDNGTGQSSVQSPDPNPESGPAEDGN